MFKDYLDPTLYALIKKHGGEAVLDNYAKNDGYYQQMTVGNAEQLVSTVFIEDKTPYTFRTSGGSMDIGDREYDEIVGGTVAWNQLVKNGDFSDGTTGWERNNGNLSASGGILTFTANSGSTAKNFSPTTSRSTPTIVGHKYFYAFSIKVSDTSLGTFKYSPLDIGLVTHSLISNTDTRIMGIANITSATNGRTFFYPWGSSVVSTTGTETAELHDVMTIDLTQMFGSTIADYIYTLETATPGAGVAWFKKLFPKDYYPYNAGTLLSVNASAHKLVGFNAYDHANTSAKVVGGNQYQITGTYTSISLDGTTITPDSDGYFTPSVSGTLSVVGGNATDTCIHLVWDGERDGEYEPYEVYNYPLDSSLTLRGIPKLNAGNNLYYDGDTYESDGTVTRKYGIVDLGTLNWVSDPNRSSVFYTSGLASVMVKTSPFADAVCNKYILQKLGPDVLISGQFSTTNAYGGGNIFFKDDNFIGKTGSEVKALMSGVYLVYELATPTTESADPFSNPQIVNDFGTEEYVVTEQNGVAVPVGHITKYANNLRAKLEMAPDSPSQGDGDYIVRQTDGENEYVALSSNATVSGLTTRCPVCPTDTDGTYVLKATVSGGAVVYSWEAE